MYCRSCIGMTNKLRLCGRLLLRSGGDVKLKDRFKWHIQYICSCVSYIVLYFTIPYIRLSVDLTYRIY